MRLRVDVNYAPSHALRRTPLEAGQWHVDKAAIKFVAYVSTVVLLCARSSNYILKGIKRVWLFYVISNV